MGTNASRHKKRPQTYGLAAKVPINDQIDSSRHVAMDSESKFDEKTIKYLLKELEETPEIFILNQLIMSVMFFENYGKTQEEQKQHATKLEKDLNPKLLCEQSIECIIPDTIFEEVSKNVQFQKKEKNIKLEPIVPKRLFVINDKIEVFDSVDVPDYTSIDKPNYLGIIEDIVPNDDDEYDKKGFVKIQLVSLHSNNKPIRYKIPDPNPVPVSKDSSTVNKDGNSDEETTFIEGHYKPRKQLKPQEVYQDGEYDYSKITEAKTPKPLKITDFNRRTTLPNTCFIIKNVPKLTNTNLDSDDSDSEAEYYGKDELYEEICYISSQGFMDHFQNAAFPNSLGKSLGFDNDSIRNANAIPGMIFCKMKVSEDTFIPCEVIPSVAISWPTKLTLNFEKRPDRPTITDIRTGLKYRWPTDEMISEVKCTNCVLIPKGFLPKRGENPEMDIEWEYGFPRAERYIDTRMSHAQMRCFLIILTLHKTYIEPKTLNHGLLVEHIRNHMYWEVEANYKDWPEHKLGIKILKVISNLEKKLSKGIMYDYFIPEKNLFENIPNMHLRIAQKVFHDVLETPLPKIIFALKNLIYINENFYPMIDFKILYEILRSNGIRALISDNRPVNVRRHRKQQMNVEGDVMYKQNVNWKYKIEKKNREKVLAKRAKLAEKAQLENPKVNTDSIEDEWTFDKNLNLLKVREILLFYCNHFIEMAKQSQAISTKNQALFYLKQAFYICQILEEKHQITDAEEFRAKIREEETNCQLRQKGTSSDPPLTPVRNTEQFYFVQKKSNLRKTQSHLATKKVTIEPTRNNISYIL